MIMDYNSDCYYNVNMELANMLDKLSIGDNEKEHVQNILKHDMTIIVECWQNEMMNLETSNLKLYNGMCGTTTQLFYELVKHVTSTISIIDIMPYIDDYLEYYEILHFTIN